MGYEKYDKHGKIFARVIHQKATKLLHHHPKKDETMYILSGAGYIEFEDRKEYFGKNDTIRIKPLENHTIVAMENTVLHEISTPHPNDTVRVRDYYDVR